MHYYIIIIKTIESIIHVAQVCIRQKNNFNARTYMKKECKLEILLQHCFCKITPNSNLIFPQKRKVFRCNDYFTYFLVGDGNLENKKHAFTAHVHVWLVVLPKHLVCCALALLSAEQGGAGGQRDNERVVTLQNSCRGGLNGMLRIANTVRNKKGPTSKIVKIIAA